MVNDPNVREVRYLDAGNVKARRLVFLCVGAVALLLESPCLYAFCETEAMSACAANDQQCVYDAGTAATHAVRDCKASAAGNGNYGLRVRTFSMANLKRSSFGDALQLLAPALAAQRPNFTRRTACVTAEHSAEFRVRPPVPVPSPVRLSP
jgi:hypothetical protein